MEKHVLTQWRDICLFQEYCKDDKPVFTSHSISGSIVRLQTNSEVFDLDFQNIPFMHQRLFYDWLKGAYPEAAAALEEVRFISGMDLTQGIVATEIHDTYMVVYTELNGKVESQKRPHRYWTVSEKPVNRNSTPLAGNQHFKYLTFSEEPFRLFQRNAFWSPYDPKESAQVLMGHTYFKGLAVKDVSVLSFDIETTGIEHDDTSRVLLISNTFRRGDTVIKRLFAFDEYKTEAAIFDDWSAWVRELNPSLVIGHNIYGYDFPYMAYCAERAGTSLILGRDNTPIEFEERESRFRKDASQFYSYHRAKIYGREIIDTMFLSIKYDAASKKYESYNLKAIIRAEGLEKADRQFYDAGSIRHNYTNPVEFAKIKQYAKDDADDALALFDLMIPAYFYLAQFIPKPFDAIINGATGSQINAFLARSYLQNRHSLPLDSPANEYEGAISFGNPGIYQHCFKMDVASLYPSIILQYEVYDKEKDPNRHFLRMVSSFTKQRLYHKQAAKETGSSFHKDMSEALKIVINSGYGFMGAPGLLFNSPKLAAFVTQKGRDILTTSIDWASRNGFKTPNGDTDSIMVTNGAPIPETERKRLLDDLNALYPDRIRFEDDGYYESVVIVKAKNYALQSGDKIKIKGSALKATFKEPALREFLDKSLKSLLKGNIDQVITYYTNAIKEIYNLESIDRWASKKTVTEKVMSSERANETKIVEALEGSEHTIGDKIYVYFAKDGSIKLKEDWTNDHDEVKLASKLFNTVKVFSTVLNMDAFPNYSLKRNNPMLYEMLGRPLPEPKKRARIKKEEIE